MAEIIRGIAASGGKAKGVARVILSDEDLDFVEKGEVIICRITSPDYIIAMSKANAIVADLGGVATHAAIVSRELGIPCVTGTKTATKLIKTGDEVFVDGDEGIVSRL